MSERETDTPQLSKETKVKEGKDLKAVSNLERYNTGFVGERTGSECVRLWEMPTHYKSNLEAII